MFRTLPLSHCLFFDIETTTPTEHLEDAPERLRELWAERCQRLSKDGDCEPSRQWSEQASLQPEFGQVVCIVLSKFKTEPTQLVQTALDREPRLVPPPLTARRFVLLPPGTPKLTDQPQIDGQTQTMLFETEQELLRAFSKTLDNAMSRPATRLIGHNSNAYDVPFLTRRAIIQGLMPPRAFHTIDSKPWERQLVDLMSLWTFGSKSYGSYVTLNELTVSLGLPSPKDEMHGSEVGGYFFRDPVGYLKIADYCEKDVASVGAVLNKLHSLT